MKVRTIRDISEELVIRAITLVNLAELRHLLYIAEAANAADKGDFRDGKTLAKLSHEIDASRAAGLFGEVSP